MIWFLLKPALLGQGQTTTETNTTPTATLALPNLLTLMFQEEAVVPTASSHKHNFVAVRRLCQLLKSL